MHKKPSKEIIVTVLEKKHGNLAESARAIGVSRSALAKWISKDRALSQALEDIREGMIDFTESQMMLLIRGIPKFGKKPDGTQELVGYLERPDSQLIKFNLSTRGRHRGYGEHLGIEHSGGVKIEWHEEKTYVREADSETDTGA